MKYTVVWQQTAENQLAALWIRAANKDALSGYAEQIDRILERDPHNHGESRNLNTRLAFFRPLCVRFEIDEAAKQVNVIAVKWVGR